jgi:hypothetical protein
MLSQQSAVVVRTVAGIDILLVAHPSFAEGVGDVREVDQALLSCGQLMWNVADGSDAPPGAAEELAATLARGLDC